MFGVFPAPAGMSLTKLSLAGTAGDGKIANLFLQCMFSRFAENSLDFKMLFFLNLRF
jgi:hypothetical protein